VNESQSRKIAERAKAVRPLLDLLERLTRLQWVSRSIGWMGICLVGTMAIRYLLPTGMEWAAPIVMIAPVSALAVRFHLTRHKRLRGSRAKMVCPRCRYILREVGPDLWTSCDDTVRVCPECAFAVSDDVYAAAALPAVRPRAALVVGASSGVIWGSIILLTLYLGGISLVLFVVRPSDGLSGWLVAAGAFQLFAFVLLVLFARRVNRAIDARVASWRVVPFCTKCDAALPDGARELSLAVCGECGRRVSPPAALAEARRAAIR
jgi:hypothetical protein